MKKKRAVHIGARGIRLKALGYTTNASPGPVDNNHIPGLSGRCQEHTMTPTWWNDSCINQAIFTNYFLTLTQFVFVIYLFYYLLINFLLYLIVFLYCIFLFIFYYFLCTHMDFFSEINIFVCICNYIYIYIYNELKLLLSVVE